MARPLSADKYRESLTRAGGRAYQYYYGSGAQRKAYSSHFPEMKKVCFEKWDYSYKQKAIGAAHAMGIVNPGRFMHAWRQRSRYVRGKSCCKEISFASFH